MGADEYPTPVRNTLVDQMRRDRASRRRLHEAAPELTAHHTTTENEEEDDLIMDASSLGDERLRLLLLCCHPALDRDTQVALTLRLAGWVAEGSAANRSFSNAEPFPDSPTPLSSPLVSVPTAMIENTASTITMTVASRMIQL